MQAYTAAAQGFQNVAPAIQAGMTQGMTQGVTQGVSQGTSQYIANMIVSSPYVVMGMIVVLVILVIGMYIYYHGLFIFGPYAVKTSKKKVACEEDSDDVDALINEINKK